MQQAGRRQMQKESRAGTETEVGGSKSREISSSSSENAVETISSLPKVYESELLANKAYNLVMGL